MILDEEMIKNKEFNKSKIPLESRQVTKYDNQLNNLVAKLTSNEMDIFWEIITDLSETSQRKLVISYQQIVKNIGYKGRTSRLARQIEKIADSLATARLYQKNVDRAKWKIFPIFDVFEGDDDEKTLTVEVSTHFMPMINDLGKEYTRFVFQQFNSLKSKYAKTLFRLLKQYHITGELRINKAKLYETLGVPESYYQRSDLARQRAIEPAIKELTDKHLFENLKYRPIRNDPTKKRSKIIGYIFNFKPQKDKEDLPLESSNQRAKDVVDGNYRKVSKNKKEDETKVKNNFVKSKEFKSSKSVDNTADFDNFM